MSEPDPDPQDEPRLRLTEEQIREVGRIRQGLRDGSMAFATDAQMDAFWKKCGL